MFGFQIGGKCSLSTAQLSGGWNHINTYVTYLYTVLDIYIITVNDDIWK